jgi:hypothetical protein
MQRNTQLSINDSVISSTFKFWPHPIPSPGLTVAYTPAIIIMPCWMPWVLLQMPSVRVGVYLVTVKYKATDLNAFPWPLSPGSPLDVE